MVSGGIKLKTIVDQKIVINGQIFFSHGCKFEDECPKYNPALILEKPTPHLNKCTSGGGTAYTCWKIFTNGKYDNPEDMPKEHYCYGGHK